MKYEIEAKQVHSVYCVVLKEVVYGIISQTISGLSRTRKSSNIIYGEIEPTGLMKSTFRDTI